MATIDPKILEYLQQTGKLPPDALSSSAVTPDSEVPSPDIELTGLIAAQNQDADRRRLMALGAAGERASAAIGGRTPNLQPFQPANQAVKDYVLRNQVTRQAEEGRRDRAKAASAALADKAKMDLSLGREESQKALREARIADLQQKPELAGQRLSAAADKQKALEEFRAGQLKLGAERNQIARSRPRGVGSGGGSENDMYDKIAEEIEAGRQPPPTGTRVTKHVLNLRAAFARRGFDLTQAQIDWRAMIRHYNSLNGPTQLKLRQAVTFVKMHAPVVADLFQKWKETGLVSGFRDFNRASLAAAKKMPGETGAIAQNLEAQINDLVSELATAYKGGNASTDETLKLAKENLESDWNEETFVMAIKLMQRNMGIRLNAIANTKAAGVSAGSKYARGAESSGSHGEEPTVIERRKTPSGKVLEKLSDGTIREVK